MRKFPPEREHHEKWSRAMCSVSSFLFVVSLMMLWGSLSISRGSHQLATQESSLLLPGFQQLEHPQPGRQLQGSLLASYKSLATAESAAAAAEQQQEQQQQQQQALPQLQPLVADVPGYSRPPYILPKLIHQTVKDKRSMSCEVQESIQSWIDMNPGYTHILYDDADLLEFVRQHFPDLLPIYQGLPTNIERTDTWRYLVLHKLGGVYADSDVKCMQPISTWNQEHNFDAALMVGIAKRNMKTGDTREFNQFVMAAMPGHPVLATMPLVIAGNLAASLLRGLPLKGQGKAADETVLASTGPVAFTSALEAYAHRVGTKWPVNSTQADLQGGVLFGTVRAMPKFVLGTGWDTLDHNLTCEEVKQTIRPEALICHQFFGTWKSRPEKAVRARQFTYGDCSRRNGEQKQEQQEQQQLPAAADTGADSFTLDGGQEPPEDTFVATDRRQTVAVSYTGASVDSVAGAAEEVPAVAAAAAAVSDNDDATDTVAGTGDVVLTAAVPDDDSADTEAAEAPSPASTSLVQEVVYTARTDGADPAGVLTSGREQEQQQQQDSPLSQIQDAEAQRQQQQQQEQQPLVQQEPEQQTDAPAQEQQPAEQQLQDQQLDQQAQAPQPEEQQPQQEQQLADQQVDQQVDQQEEGQQLAREPDQQLQEPDQPRDEQAQEQQPAKQQQEEQQPAQRQQQQPQQEQPQEQQQPTAQQPVQQEQQQELELQAQYKTVKEQLHQLEDLQQQLQHHAVPA